MTSNEFKKAFNENTEGQININGLIINVRVLDFRDAYGRTDVKITPVSGCGEKWVEISGVKVKDS